MAGNKIKVGIIGSAGYTGGEATRLLLNHPNADLVFVQSKSQAGQPIQEIHTDLAGETDLKFSASFDQPVDVLFLCLSHGDSKKFLQENNITASTRIIDLGNDFRLGDSVAGRQFVYGLPELNRDAIKKASNIANPGCFATTIQLGLLPLAKAKLLTEVHTTGITGSTGAGQKLQDTVHFSWRTSNISAYKTLTHQHLGEIERTLRSLDSNFKGPVNFVPWRGDFTRGIFVTSVVACDLSIEEAQELYRSHYQGHPFTHLTSKMVDIKQSVNTNKCFLYLEKVGDKLAIHSVCDNLLKGASGQAVQNMNLMFGLEETAGLALKASIY